MQERKAPVEFELLLKEWAEWKMDGCSGPLGYPGETAFVRNMGGGQRDYVPDVDRALRCSAVNDAVVAVGGIHQGIIEAVYFWPGMIGIRKLMDKHRISRATAYRWLGGARWMVWVELERVQAKRQKVA